MAQVEQLAEFVVRTSYDTLCGHVRDHLKIRVLDAVACAIGSLAGEPVRLIREQIEDFGGTRYCTLIGGGRTAPDRATLFNGALVRYLDFNDSYLAKGETCHPSDNLAPILAAAEYAERNGRDLFSGTCRGLPGPVPVERCGAGPRQGLRSYDPGLLRGRSWSIARARS